MPISSERKYDGQQCVRHTDITTKDLFALKVASEPDEN